MLRFLTAGESHGKAEIAILEGIPAGLNLTEKDIQKELDKRQGGAGRGGRGQIEKDEVKILSGIRNGKTIGSPISLIVVNLDHINWEQKIKEKVTNPRPGHADLPGVLKYGFDDTRNIIERASARETVMRVAIGAVCKQFLKEFEVVIISHTLQIGEVKLRKHSINYKKIAKGVENSSLTHCVDPGISKLMEQAISKAQKKKDTLGGIIEVVAHNIPIGLGSHVHWDRRLDGKLAQMLMDIPSVKAVEIGEGIMNSTCYGSQVHDEIFYRSKGYYRKTNRAGGIEGGISNGEDIICRVYLKPISTLGNPLNSVDIATKKPVRALIERSDICVVPRAGVIAESAVAYVLSDAFLEKFGGDSLTETKRNYQGYLKQLAIASKL